MAALGKEHRAPGRGDSKYKGPEVGASLAYLRKNQLASVAEAE